MQLNWERGLALCDFYVTFSEPIKPKLMEIIKFLIEFGAIINLGVLITFFLWFMNHLYRIKRLDVDRLREFNESKVELLKDKHLIEIQGLKNQIDYLNIKEDKVLVERLTELKEKLKEFKTSPNNDAVIRYLRNEIEKTQTKRLKIFSSFSMLVPSSPDTDFDNKIFLHYQELLENDDLTKKSHAIRLLSVLPIQEAQQLIIDHLKDKNFHVRTMAMNSVLTMSIFHKNVVELLLEKVMDSKHEIIRDIIRVLKLVAKKEDYKMIKDTIESVNDPGIEEFFMKEFDL